MKARIGPPPWIMCLPQHRFGNLGKDEFSADANAQHDQAALFDLLTADDISRPVIMSALGKSGSGWALPGFHAEAG